MRAVEQAGRINRAGEVKPAADALGAHWAAWSSSSTRLKSESGQDPIRHPGSSTTSSSELYTTSPATTRTSMAVRRGAPRAGSTAHDRPDAGVGAVVGTGQDHPRAGRPGVQRTAQAARAGGDRAAAQDGHVAAIDDRATTACARVRTRAPNGGPMRGRPLSGQCCRGSGTRRDEMVRPNSRPAGDLEIGGPPASSSPPAPRSPAPLPSPAATVSTIGSSPAAPAPRSAAAGPCRPAPTDG